MIYVDKNHAVEGRAHYWRIFADTPEELREALKAAHVSSLTLSQVGEPNEHAYVSTAQMKKFKGAVEIDQRGLVKLIRSKRMEEIAAIPDEDIDTSDIPEAPDFAGYDVRRPGSGRVTITTKATQTYNESDPDPDEDDDEAME